MRFAAVASVVFAAALAAVAGPQDESTRPRRVQPERRSDQALELRSDLVTLTVSVSDSNGRPVPLLSPDSFKVYEDDKLQKVEYFEPIGDPYSMILMLDKSGSSAEEMGNMCSAAKEFVSGIGEKDKLGIVSFSRAIDMHGDLTGDQSDLNKSLDDIVRENRRRLGGKRFDETTGTSFYDALYLACAESPLAEEETNGRKAVIVFSDCVDSTSAYKYDDIIDAVERSGASVYFLLFDTRDFSDRLLTRPDAQGNTIVLSPSQLNRFYDEFAPSAPDRDRDPREYSPLERLEINHNLYDLATRQAQALATRTGGRVYPVRRIGDLGAAYREISAELKTRYAVGYYPTNTKHDGSWRTLKVVVPGSPGAKVVTRTGYWAPKN